MATQQCSMKLLNKQKMIKSKLNRMTKSKERVREGAGLPSIYLDFYTILDLK